MHWIDLNCDAGEGVGNEDSLFPLISSCSIACGGHSGNEASIRKTIGLALKHNVRIGAHPSYPDRENFGQESLEMDIGELMDSLGKQLYTFREIAKDMEAPFHHIKAHGALYNDLARGGFLADQYLTLLKPYLQEVRLYGPCGSNFIQMAISRGFKVWREAFIDRAYESDGSLVSRKKPGSVFTAPESVFKQLKTMVLEGQIRSVDGDYIKMRPQTYCLHGDTPNAVEILMYLSNALSKAQISIRK